MLSLSAPHLGLLSNDHILVKRFNIDKRDLIRSFFRCEADSSYVSFFKELPRYFGLVSKSEIHRKQCGYFDCLFYLHYSL